MADYLVDAVLFDLDGTLVDSSASVERAWHRVSDELAVPIDAFEPYMHGIPAAQVFQTVAPHLSAVTVADLTERMLLDQTHDSADVTAQPGALAALDGVPTSRWAVVTSGDRRLAAARIRAAGLPMPRVLVTADDVPVGKPDPACYLLGAARLGYPPQRCLVVEDAPAGVAAGRAAGMPVVGVLTTYDQLDEATGTVRDWSEVRMDTDRLGVHVVLSSLSHRSDR